MGIRADRDPRAGSRGDAQTLHVEVLPIRVRVDLKRSPGLDRTARHPVPVAKEAGPEVVDTAAGWART